MGVAVYWIILAVTGAIFLYKTSQYGMRPKGYPPGIAN